VDGIAPPIDDGADDHLGLWTPARLTPHALSGKHFLFPTDRVAHFFPSTIHRAIDNFAWRLSLHLLKKYWPSQLPVEASVLNQGQRLSACSPLLSTNGQYSLELVGGSIRLVKMIANRKGWQTLWEPVASREGVTPSYVELNPKGALVAMGSDGGVCWELGLSDVALGSSSFLQICSYGSLVLMDDGLELWSSQCDQSESCTGLHHRHWPIKGLLLKYNQLLFNLAEREYTRQSFLRATKIVESRTFIEQVAKDVSKMQRSASW